jgi:site-specific DNA recombinase
MKKVRIYTRFSPRRKAEDCVSCETQEQLCRDHAKKMGYEVVEVYSDEAKSGKDLDRPALQNILADLKKNEILLVYKRDRLARDLMVGEFIRRDVLKSHARIESLDGIDIDDKDPTAVLLRQIMDAFAEYERKQIAIRTSHAMKRHQLNGRKMSSQAPYGYYIDGDSLKRSNCEQEVIDIILDMLKKQFSQRNIVKFLNNHHKDAARGKQWNLMTVQRIIKREKENR